MIQTIEQDKQSLMVVSIVALKIVCNFVALFRSVRTAAQFLASAQSDGLVAEEDGPKHMMLEMFDKDSWLYNNCLNGCYPDVYRQILYIMFVFS